MSCTTFSAPDPIAHAAVRSVREARATEAQIGQVCNISEDDLLEAEGITLSTDTLVGKYFTYANRILPLDLERVGEDELRGILSNGRKCMQVTEGVVHASRNDLDSKIRGLNHLCNVVSNVLTRYQQDVRAPSMDPANSTHDCEWINKNFVELAGRFDATLPFLGLPDASFDKKFKRYETLVTALEMQFRASSALRDRLQSIAENYDAKFTDARRYLQDALDSVSNVIAKREQARKPGAVRQAQQQALMEQGIAFAKEGVSPDELLSVLRSGASAMQEIGAKERAVSKRHSQIAQQIERKSQQINRIREKIEVAERARELAGTTRDARAIRGKNEECKRLHGQLARALEEKEGLTEQAYREESKLSEEVVASDASLQAKVADFLHATARQREEK